MKAMFDNICHLLLAISRMSHNIEIGLILISMLLTTSIGSEINDCIFLYRNNIDSILSYKTYVLQESPDGDIDLIAQAKYRQSTIAIPLTLKKLVVIKELNCSNCATNSPYNDSVVIDDINSANFAQLNQFKDISPPFTTA